MKLLLDFPTIGEPHYAQAIAGEPDQGQAGQVLQARGEHAIRGSTRSETDGGITRTGKKRRRQDDRHPQPLRARQHRGRAGRRHGVLPRHEHRAGLGHPARLRGPRHEHVGADPAAGRDAHAHGCRRAPASIPFYCTDFCSALHQEMQGYVRVSPAGSPVKLMANVSKKAQAQMQRKRRREAERMMSQLSRRAPRARVGVCCSPRSPCRSGAFSL